MIKSGVSSLSRFIQRNFNDSMQKTNQAVERITTGKRVNKAADDVGAFHLQSTMNAEVRSSRMAVRNLDQAFNLYEQAGRSLEEVYQVTKKLRQLAVQASNDTLNDEDRNNAQLVFDDLKTSIDSIANSSNYNQQKLLAVNKVDLALLVDVSGSMHNAQENVSDAISDVAERIESANINLQMGVVEMASRLDSNDWTTKTADLSEPTSSTFLNAVDGLDAIGAAIDPYAALLETSGANELGGDGDNISWRADSTAKLIVMITDTGDEGNATLHGSTNEAGTATDLANYGVEVHVIGESGSNTATDAIVSATGGSFQALGGYTASNVESALFNIADQLVADYGGGEALNLQIARESGDSGAMVSSLASNITTAALGVSDSNVRSLTEAQVAIDQINGALDAMEYIRGNIGAEYQRLLHMSDVEHSRVEQAGINLNVISDANIANETVELTTNQMRMQVGQASISQARQIEFEYVKNLLLK